MTYIIEYKDSAAEAYDSIDRVGRDQTATKLYNIAADEYREPWDWDYKLMKTSPAEGRLRVGDDIRVFVNIDRSEKILKVIDVGRRENLY